jgi:uncharacterized FlaG/YvyC family protein
MSDISVLPVLGNPAATSGRAAREDIQPTLSSLADVASRQTAIKMPVRGEDTMTAFESMIDRYVPKDRPNTRLQIEHDKTTGLFIYRSVDKDSGEVLRQYPADEVLRFISYYRESEGLVVDSQA